jgi:uncharacterized membrane protein
VRDRDGTLTSFDAPGSVGTSANAINPEGAIAGAYQDASLALHGFVRARDGTFTSFDAPGSAGTFGNAINPAGAITGNYIDASNQFIAHGFVRARDGTFTTFDPGLTIHRPRRD